MSQRAALECRDKPCYSDPSPWLQRGQTEGGVGLIQRGVRQSGIKRPERGVTVIRRGSLLLTRPSRAHTTCTLISGWWWTPSWSWGCYGKSLTSAVVFSSLSLLIEHKEFLFFSPRQWRASRVSRASLRGMLCCYKMRNINSSALWDMILHLIPVRWDGRKTLIFICRFYFA